jgi:hypothetical protein
MARDWKGGNASTFKTIGASNHCDEERADKDYYATEPAATEWLCKLEQFSKFILEPSCGEGHMSEVLKRHGYNVVSRDLADRGYGEVADFLSDDNTRWDGDIVTNPPYAFAQQFVEKTLAIIPTGRKVAMFLKLTFLEGKGRAKMFETTPPIRVWVSRSRLKCAKNGDFEHSPGSATCYAWFVWEKGFAGHPEIRWFN